MAQVQWASRPGRKSSYLKQQPVIINSYGDPFSWQPSSQFALSGWFGAAYLRLIGRGDGEVLSYVLTLAFPDLGSGGNLLGVVVGAQAYLTSFSGGNPQSFEVDLLMHIEAFYRRVGASQSPLTKGL